jgi:aryl-alcohol dehydrogenase-like predicted oxidoreductase
VVAAISAAFDAGVNWIDTAEGYGGGSEEVTAQRSSAAPRSR